MLNLQIVQLLAVELRKDVLRIAAKMSLGKRLRATRELFKVSLNAGYLTLPSNIPFASHAHILIYFDPYEMEKVKQENSSKCSNLICCRGQVHRPFPCDSLAVRVILVLLMTSNEHRQLGQCIVNGRRSQQQPFLRKV